MYLMYIYIFAYSIHNTVFKTLTDAVREQEIQRNDPSQVMEESRSS